jgi:hypothetical protein
VIAELKILADEIAALKLFSAQIADSVASGIAEDMAQLMAILDDFYGG